MSYNSGENTGNPNSNSRRRENSRNSLTSRVSWLQSNMDPNSDVNHVNIAGDTISNEPSISSTNTSLADSVASLGFDLSNPDQDMDDVEKYATSLKVREYRPFRLSEIIPGHPWPKNLQELMRNPLGDTYSSASTLNSVVERKMTISEVTALLCHSALVEVGFIPETSISNSNLSPQTICTMGDSDRIERFGKRVNPVGYNSNAAVFAWTYQVVNLVHVHDDDKDKSVDKAEKNRGSQPQCTEMAAEDMKDKIEQLCDCDKYEFSPPCSIIIIPKGAKSQIFCNFPGSTSNGTKPFQQTLDVDLKPFMEDNITGLESLKLTAEEWMKIMNFNGTKFSTSFKSAFAMFCLDAMNGIMFDLRGLVCLPPEILIRIFSYSDLRSIRNTRLTCRYLNDVGNIPGLWRSLIWRDFGSAPSVPTARFARFFTRIPYDLSQNIFDAPQDYRAIYEAHRRSNFRSRFDAGGGLVNRLGGRNSWVPYVNPPRPYLFRLSYDLPPLSPPLHPVNMFFDF